MSQGKDIMMVVPEPHSPSRPDTDVTLMHRVVEDARAALDAPYIVMTHFDAASGTARSVATGGLCRPAVQRVLDVLRRVLPDFDPLDHTFPADANEHVRAVYHHRRTVIAGLESVFQGVAPDFAARFARRAANLTHVLLVPLHVDDRVFGALACLQRESDFGEGHIRIARAFANQVALTIRNAELLDEQRRITLALEESRHLAVQAEERTRREISEFLHSRVQSRLLVAWYHLGDVRAADAESQDRLDSVRRELEDLRERDVRQVSHQLHPEALSVGLIAALQVLASRLSGVVNVSIHADAPTRLLDDPLDNGLPMPLRLAVFRIAEEGVTNVLKHAQASHVSIVLSTGRTLRLDIIDDGRGFDPRTVERGFGLGGIAARVESTGGTWGLDSRPGGPTRLWAEVPR